MSTEKIIGIVLIVWLFVIVVAEVGLRRHSKRMERLDDEWANFLHDRFGDDG